MRRKETSDLAILAMFVATLTVLAVVNTFAMAWWPFPIRPTILQVPVIIASIVLGPKLGGIVGFWWGINSTVLASTLAPSFLFSPVVPVVGTQTPSIWGLFIAVVPRIFVGILPYFVYRLFHQHKKISRIGLTITGAIGSMINTVFVLSAIYWIFGNVLDWTLQTLLASVVATNSLAEAVISAILVAAVTPTLLKVYKRV